jgi:hypothetical protein
MFRRPISRKVSFGLFGPLRASSDWKIPLRPSFGLGERGRQRDHPEEPRRLAHRSRGPGARFGGCGHGALFPLCSWPVVPARPHARFALGSGQVQLDQESGRFRLGRRRSISAQGVLSPVNSTVAVDPSRTRVPRGIRSSSSPAVVMFWPSHPAPIAQPRLPSVSNCSDVIKWTWRRLGRCGCLRLARSGHRSKGESHPPPDRTAC